MALSSGHASHTRASTATKRRQITSPASVSPLASGVVDGRRALVSSRCVFVSSRRPLVSSAFVNSRRAFVIIRHALVSSRYALQQWQVD